MFLSTQTAPFSVLPILTPSAFNKRTLVNAWNVSASLPSIIDSFLPRSAPANILAHWSEPPNSRRQPYFLLRYTKSYACINIYPISKKVNPPFSKRFLYASQASILLTLKCTPISRIKSI